MKNRGDLIARLKLHDHQQCKEYLDAFASDLGRMNVVPFSGIRIRLGHCQRACETSAPGYLYHSILHELPLKSVSIELVGELSKNRSCPGSVLVRTLFTHFSGVLEEISLFHTGPHQDLVFGHFKDCSFPNLKVLNLGDDYERCDPTYMTNVLSALVAGAPKLQELHAQGPINLMLKVLERSSARLVTLSRAHAPFDEIPENRIDGIRLKKVRLHYTGPNFNVERFNRITPTLLRESCKETLQVMDIDPFLAVPLMCYGIRLDHVKCLAVDINPAHMELDDLRIVTIFKNFDFTRTFPNLKFVCILPPFDNLELSTDHMNGFVEQANASLKEPEPDRAINIKELELLTRVSAGSAEFYTEMFPHIEGLRVQEEGGEISLEFIWKHWVNLKEVEIMGDVGKHVPDLDSVICGIFPEEVAELRQQDEEYLKKVNIVPVMSAITCLRNLRKFVLILNPVSDETPRFDSLDCVQTLPSLSLSKVAGLIAFARCPNLVVTLSTDGSHIYEALRNMEPYVSVEFNGVYLAAVLP